MKANHEWVNLCWGMAIEVLAGSQTELRNTKGPTTTDEFCRRADMNEECVIDPSVGTTPWALTWGTSTYARRLLISTRQLAVEIATVWATAWS
ncbi:hypothetical protein DVH05_005423 [Phytophthora capsici]|nr:hypothetical protein DVH05_005423 [Phytophthora capsici]